MHGIDQKSVTYSTEAETPPQAPLLSGILEWPPYHHPSQPLIPWGHAMHITPIIKVGIEELVSCLTHFFLIVELFIEGTVTLLLNEASSMA